MMKKIRIGFAVSHLRLRPDIVNLIGIFNKKYDLTVFCFKEEIGLLPEECNKTIILKPSLRVQFYRFLYRYFGHLPNPRKYFINYQMRRIGKNSLRFKFILRIKIYLMAYLPKVVTYDFLLDRIGSDIDELHDYDFFLTLTDIVDDKTLADFIKSGVRSLVYVTSWDHAPKFKRLSSTKVNYLTWSKPVSEDLIFFYNVPNESIFEVGSTQFSFLNKYLLRPAPAPVFSSRYIYYIAAMGYPDLIEQEVQLVLVLARLVAYYCPEWKIVFRQYPILSDGQKYDDLLKVSNIVFDGFRLKSSGSLFSLDDLKYKYDVIYHAEAVFHLGTTMGIEACSFPTPVFTFSGSNFDNQKLNRHKRLSASLNQYHLRRHVQLEGYENVIKTTAQLEKVIQSLYISNNQFLDYNNSVASTFSAIDERDILNNIDSIITRKAV